MALLREERGNNPSAEQELAIRKKERKLRREKKYKAWGWVKDSKGKYRPRIRHADAYAPRRIIKVKRGALCRKVGHKYPPIKGIFGRLRTRTVYCKRCGHPKRMKG